jgi:hypothetical protein
MYRTASKEFKYDHHRAILPDRQEITMEIHFKLVPLFPRMKASPYLFFSWPFTYSSVCSIAMFMYPSRQAKIPAQRKMLVTISITLDKKREIRAFHKVGEIKLKLQ